MTKATSSILHLAMILVLFTLSGCVSKYQNTISDDYATLELVSQSEATLFADDYYAEISDYSGGCNASESLGIVITDSMTKTKTARIPVNKPLKIRANYALSSYDEMSIILTPRQKTHYVIEYVQADRQFYIYIKTGKQRVDIPSSDIRMFHVRECL